MNNAFTGVLSDTVQKITQLGPEIEACIATTGYDYLCDIHAESAVAAARELGTSDIRVIPAALDRGSRPWMYELTKTLAEAYQLSPHEQYSRTLAGDRPLQGFLLAGRASGMLGYVYHEFWYRDGEIILNRKEYLGDDRHIEVTEVEPQIVREFALDPETDSTAGGVDILRRWLALAKRVNPFCGGPDQIVAIDRSGARCIEHPPVGTAAAEMAHATITASISITAPILTGTTSV
jgi:hypothetical protein